jgi:lipoprotein-anchoring transpeptidase ErfK/SrfK
VKSAGRALRIGLLVALGTAGFSAALVLAAVGGAGTSGPQQTDTTTTTTSTETTTTEPTVPPRLPTIPSGVTIGSVDVGDLLPYQASAAVRSAFDRPLILVATPTRQYRIKPSKLGAEPYVKKAVSRARFARPGAAIPLDVQVNRAKVRAYVERIGRKIGRPAVDARLVLRRATVRVIPSRDGHSLLVGPNTRTIRAALATNRRAPIQLEIGAVKAKVTEKNLGPAVVIMRESKRLRLFRNGKLVRTFGVATGQSSFPTPIGNFEVVTMQRNPWWYPPPSDWAEDADPVPPGPGNPLGTRWMGISAPYVGIHGTPDSASIGYSASHGCVRMRIPEAEWLFQQVEIGTPVFIVRV